MENQNNTPTRSTPACSGEHAGADTNASGYYRATVAVSVGFLVDIALKARSLGEAERKVDFCCGADDIPLGALRSKDGRLAIDIHTHRVRPISESEAEELPLKEFAYSDK